jgi:RNA polymerase sigma factor (sigma-70 family)
VGIYEKYIIQTIELDNIIDKISLEEREIIIDYYFHGMSVNKIAEKLGIAHFVAYKYLQKAKGNLKQVMSL